MLGVGQVRVCAEVQKSLDAGWAAVLGRESQRVAAPRDVDGVHGCAGQVLLSRNGFTVVRGYPSLSLGYEPTLRAAAGTVLYLGLVTLLSFGLATALAHTSAALTTLLGLLYLTPILAQFIVDESWHTRIEKYAPMTAGLTVQATRDLGSLPIPPWAGLGVLAVYTGAALALGAALFTLRDA